MWSGLLNPMIHNIFPSFACTGSNDCSEKLYWADDGNRYNNDLGILPDSFINPGVGDQACFQSTPEANEVTPVECSTPTIPYFCKLDCERSNYYLKKCIFLG